MVYSQISYGELAGCPDSKLRKEVGQLPDKTGQFIMLSDDKGKIHTLHISEILKSNGAALISSVPPRKSFFAYRVSRHEVNGFFNTREELVTELKKYKGILTDDDSEKPSSSPGKYISIDPGSCGD
jgi:hypothetical protein